MNLLLLFNHRLTHTQEVDARENLGVEQIVAPPSEISKRWAGVPPEIDDLGSWLVPVTRWLTEMARPGDYVLIQGEFGATLLVVNEAFRLGLIPVYSTSRRQAVEEHMPDGSVHLSHVFTHVRFRRYSP